MTILGGVASSDRLMGGLYNLHNKKALHDEVREEDKIFGSSCHDLRVRERERK